jgi:hypothetical protein
MSFLNIGSSKHQIGHSSCDECLSGYPRKCRCGGMIHAEFGGQNMPSKYLCDKCNDKFVKNSYPNKNYKTLPKKNKVRIKNDK